MKYLTQIRFARFCFFFGSENLRTADDGRLQRYLPVCADNCTISIPTMSSSLHQRSKEYRELLGSLRDDNEPVGQ